METWTQGLGHRPGHGLGRRDSDTDLNAETRTNVLDWRSSSHGLGEGLGHGDSDTDLLTEIAPDLDMETRTRRLGYGLGQRLCHRDSDTHSDQSTSRDTDSQGDREP
ncbi:hypothetical protein PBY51_018582 [Eleginops maclovinus]|uniref:Uncharacterized protein n=1 Tax=Eleginops maclovinus TaxID=56733 RepID=A0AAN8AYB2_ELEMC|nr:hypothetical protein PBY51_018582 [Eleginops maclovinus]